MIPDAQNQHIPILMYHSISNYYTSPKFRPCVVSPELFEQHLSYLDQHHYTPVTVTHLAQAMAQGGQGLPARPVVLTFDDGYADFYTDALPRLKRYGFAATLYIPTAFVGNTSRWLERMGEGMRPLLTWEQVAEISASGIECGAHTHSHPPLDWMPLTRAWDEIVHSKELLEDHLGQPVLSFAYPYGYYSARVKKLVQAAGFVSACAVKLAMSSLRDDPYALARLAITLESDIPTFDAALGTGGGSLVSSPLKQARAEMRQHMRSAYGRLLASWQVERSSNRVRKRARSEESRA